MRIKLGRPSPALVIACISLFVALGGVGYAAATGSIDGREIKNNSVASKDIKNSSIVSGDVKNSTLTGSDMRNNSVTGSDVSESSLGKVPNAGQADNAATAGSANTANTANSANSANSASSVGGLTLRKVNFETDVDVPNGPIASLAGLTINSSCTAGAVSLTARTSTDDASIHSMTADTDVDNVDLGNDLESADFDIVDGYNLLDTGDGNPNFVRFVYYTDAGSVVTGQLAVDEASNPDCAVKGTLIGG